MKGIKKSLEHRAKMSIITKALWDNGTFNRVRPFTEEHKQNISKAKLGIKLNQPIEMKRTKFYHICECCGKQFETKGACPCRKYCSFECKEISRKELRKIELVCLNCGKEFRGRPSQKYCSYECDKAYRHKMALTNIQCVQCGKIFKVRLSSQKKGRKYCSIECSTIVNRKRWVALNTGKLKCKDESTLSERNSKRMAGKNNPVFTHPESFNYKGARFYEDIGMRLRSGWEANIYRIFKHMGIDLDYEPRTFMLSDGRTYTPDFFIHETGEFIEVKGRWIGDAREKVEMFRDEYPAYPLEVIDGLEYKQYMKDFSDIVVQ